MMARWWVFAAAVGWLLGGCLTDHMRTSEPLPAGLDDAVPVDVLPEPNRARRRMNIDQLDASILRATGGLTWADSSNTNLFEVLASSLGKPDYIEITSEDLEPSPIFQKFVDDAARSVCERLLNVEYARLPADRTFFTEISADDLGLATDAQIDANLRALLLRFHGRRVLQGDTQIDSWRWLYTSSLFVSGDPGASWNNVCVALIVHADFYTY